MIISIISLIISIVAVLAAIVGNQKSTNAVFANLWFELDQLFIDYPEFHKYFYTHNITESNHVVTELTPDSKDFDRALCIAEKIVDTFQYAELFKESLSKTDKDSYEKFKKRMFSSEFMRNYVKPIWENNGSKWIISE